VSRYSKEKKQFIEFPVTYVQNQGYSNRDVGMSMNVRKDQAIDSSLLVS
jgi:hypothetical protein